MAALFTIAYGHKNKGKDKYLPVSVWHLAVASPPSPSHPLPKKSNATVLEAGPPTGSAKRGKECHMVLIGMEGRVYAICCRNKKVPLEPSRRIYIIATIYALAQTPSRRQPRQAAAHTIPTQGRTVTKNWVTTALTGVSPTLAAIRLHLHFQQTRRGRDVRTLT